MIQEKLKNLRKQKDISQEKMARILSTDTSNYSRKERGETRIHEDEWKKLAEALDVPVEFIKEENNNLSDNLNLILNDHAIVGNANCYNIPSFIIDSLQDYVSILKEQNELLKNKVIELSSKLK